MVTYRTEGATCFPEKVDFANEVFMLLLIKKLKHVTQV